MACLWLGVVSEQCGHRVGMDRIRLAERWVLYRLPRVATEITWVVSFIFSSSRFRTVRKIAHGIAVRAVI